MKLIDFLRVTNEGMDNAFFLSRDVPPGVEPYSLPTDAKEYTDINSKRRGGAKVKVRGRKTTTDKKAEHTD